MDYHSTIDPTTHSYGKFETMKKHIFLWSVPRGLSTAFERSVRELEKINVLHEPYQDAYYFGPQRKDDSLLDTYPDRFDPEASFENVGKRITTECDEYDAVFTKNMAFFVEEDYIDELIKERTFKHTFLIRDPKKAVVSLYEAFKNTSHGSLASLTTSVAGFRPLYELYQKVQEVDPNPLVIDADDLLENPKEMMKYYCTATGLPFKEDMVNWSPGPVPDWTNCTDCHVWHGAVMNSSGFKQKPKSSSPVSLSEYPKEIQDIISYSLPFYEAMYSSRIKL